MSSMKGLSICHYSFHRTWEAEKWNCTQLADHVRGLGSEGVDFHQRLVGDPGTAVGRIRAAVGASGLVLTGMSLSNNFNQADPKAFDVEVDTVGQWLQIAAEVGAPVSRIFGGHIKDRTNKKELQEGLDRVLKGLERVLPVAERSGVVLALENHGGLPCTGQEQVDVIEKIGSPWLKATIDIGNYMACGQEGAEGSRIAARHVGYVHAKDFKKIPADTPWGWKTQSCTVGEGAVDLAGCFNVLAASGYTGYVALEYEGPEDERTAVPPSLKAVRDALPA